MKSFLEITQQLDEAKDPFAAAAKAAAKKAHNDLKARLGMTKPERKDPKTVNKDGKEMYEDTLHSYTQELIKTNHPDHKIFKRATTLKGDAYKKYAHQQDTDVRDKLLQYVKEADELDEVLSKDASAGEWISDFIKSDNPKFAGKSEAKRKEMALAAYYAKQNEDISIDEANGPPKATLAFARKQSLAAALHNYKKGMANDDLSKFKTDLNKKKTANEEIELDESDDMMKRIHKEYTYHKSRPTADVLKTHKGLHRVQSKNYSAGEMGGKEGLISDIMNNTHGSKRMAAYHAMSSSQRKSLDEAPLQPNGTDKIIPDEGMCEGMCQVCGEVDCKEHFYKSPAMAGYVKEDSLNELSKDTLGSYASKSFSAGNQLHKQIRTETDPEKKAKLQAKLSQRNQGVIKAARKMRNEAVGTVNKDASGKVISWSREGDWEKMSSKNKQGSGKAANLAGRALQQTKKLDSDNTIQSRMSKARALAKQAMKDQMKEDIDRLFEKDEREYGYEGEMVMTQLKTLCRHAEHLMDMLEPDTDLPEWVQSKITLATDYMQTAHDYLMSEMNESLDEAAHVYDTKTRKVHSTYDTYRKAINAMNKLNDKHPGYDTPGGLVQSKFGAKRINEDLDEAAWGRDKMTSLRQAHDRHMEKALAANKAGDDEAVKTHQRKMQMIQGKMQKLKRNEEVELGAECEILLDEAAHTDVAGIRAKYKENEDENRHTENAALLAKHFGSKSDQDKVAKAKAHRDQNRGYGSDPLSRYHSKMAYEVHSKLYHHIREEVEDFMMSEDFEQLDELSKDTLKSYINKSAKDARIRGMMQMDYATRSKTAKNPARKAGWDKMSRDAMKAGWKREDGIKTAVGKLTKEEALDELSKSTLGSYIKKASKQSATAALGANQSAHGASDAMDKGDPRLYDLHANNYKYNKNLEKKRVAGVSKAVDKLTKEDTMLTYSEFMAQLAEGRMDDFKDKMAAEREKRLNRMDYSKEKEAAKNPVTKVKGHSYGAGEEEGEDDEGTTKTSKPASEKRGRGRPAGSKSGARV